MGSLVVARHSETNEKLKRNNVRGHCFTCCVMDIVQFIQPDLLNLSCKMSPAISSDIVRYVHQKKKEGKTYREIALEFGHQRQWAHQIYLRFDEDRNRKVTSRIGRPRKNDDASERDFIDNFLPAFRTSPAA